MHVLQHIQQCLAIPRSDRGIAYLHGPLGKQPLSSLFRNEISHQWYWMRSVFSYYSADGSGLRRAEMGLGLSYSVMLRPNDVHTTFDELGTKTTAI